MENINSNQIYEDLIANKSKIIAFDIFDTLIYRTVTPNQIVEIWAKELKKKYDLKLTCKEIVCLRKKTRKLAKIKHIINGKDRECYYKEFIVHMYNKLRISTPLYQFYKDCLRLEISVENANGYIPENISSLVKKLEHRYKIICISDMYLPAFALRSILRKKGIYIKKIYSSSDALLQKRTGRLYDYVVHKEGCNPEEITMLGDNYDSDVKNAKSHGLNAVYLKNVGQEMFYLKKEEENNKKKKEYKELLLKLKKGKEDPFSRVSTIMIIFIQRLHQKLTEDNCKDVFFLSREGEFFKKLFDEYQRRFIQHEKRIKSHYLYVSRKATLIPSIYNVNQEAFKEIYKNYKNISIIKFLMNLGLDQDEDLIRELEQIFNLDEVINNFPKSKEYDLLLKNSSFRIKCTKRAQNQRDLFVDYLDSFKVNYREDGLNLVDVGYSGTTQNNISKIFCGNVSITGYYMISYAERESITNKNKKYGILYDINKDNQKNIFTYNSAVIEMLTLASHCGVDGYYSNCKNVEPVFHYNENELRCYDTVIKNIQNTIMKYFLILIEIANVCGLEEKDYYNSFESIYKEFIFCPTKDEIDLYLTIPFVDNFAAYRIYDVNKVKKNGKLISLYGIKELIRTKGNCLKKQNTHWMAAAFSELDVRFINYILKKIPMLTIWGFDMLAKKSKREV